jgi:hypothetical protein
MLKGVRAEHPDFSSWLVNLAPTGIHPTRVDPPRRVRVRAKTYGGPVVEAEVDLVSTAGAWVLVEQLVDAPEARWYAWLPAGAVRPVRPPAD